MVRYACGLRQALGSGQADPLMVDRTTLDKLLFTTI